MSRRTATGPSGWVVVCLVAGGVATTAWAGGTLRGRVVSPTGAPRDAVSVHVTDDAGYELETRTDGEGRWRLPVDGVGLTLLDIGNQLPTSGCLRRAKTNCPSPAIPLCSRSMTRVS